MRDVYANATVRRLAARARRRSARRVRAGGSARREHQPSNFAYYAAARRKWRFYVVVRGLLSVARALAAFDWFYDAVDSPARALWARAHRRGRLVLRPQRARRSRRNGCSSAALAPSAIPLWSFAYFRFWAAQADRALRARQRFRRHAALQPVPALLGAKIGRNAVIASHAVPVTADLFGSATMRSFLAAP